MGRVLRKYDVDRQQERDREAARLFSLVPDASLTVVDRAYLAAAPLFAIQRGGTNRHWLTRAKARTAYRVIDRFKKGDELVEMQVSSVARRRSDATEDVLRARDSVPASLKRYVLPPAP